MTRRASCQPPRRPRLQCRTSLGTNFAGASDQHRTAYHQLGDDGKNGGAEKKTDYRTGYSEEKKQDVREKDKKQHRTAYASLLAEEFQFKERFLVS